MTTIQQTARPFLLDEIYESRKEIERLRRELASKEERIRWLESRLPKPELPEWQKGGSRASD